VLIFEKSAQRRVIAKDCLGDAVVERWTRDRKVAGSIPGRGAIKSTQPSIPPGWVNRVPACMAGVKAGCIHLCRVAGNPYDKRHSVAVSWNTSINDYTVPLPFYLYYRDATGLVEERK